MVLASYRLSFEGDITLRILCECVTASIVLVKHSLCACYTYVGNYASEKPVGRMESILEPILHKSTISGYGSDSNYGKHAGMY